MISASRYFAAVLLLGGCSVINSFDAVKPALKADAGAGGSGKGGRAGAGGGGGTDASVGGDTTTGGGGSTDTGGAGGAGAATGGKGGTGAVPTDGGGKDVFVPGGDEGVIVAYSKPAAPAIPELLVLDAGNGGKLLSHEPIGAVKGILNDPQTDIWYIFEQKGVATDPVILHVRELNTVTGTWLEIATKSGVPVPASRIVAMNGRIAYLSTSTPISPDPATHTLTILDTTDPTKVSVLGGVAGEHRPLPGGRKQAIVARPTGVGGTIDVAYFSATCPVAEAGEAECDVNLAAYPVDDKAVVTTTPTTKVVGKVLTSSNIQLERDSIRDAVVLTLPALVAPSVSDCSDPLTTTDLGSVQKFSPLDFAGVGQARVNYPIISQQISGGAYDACLDVMFVTTQLYDRAIWTIPLGGGPLVKKCLGTGGASMLFEPRTRTLVRAPTGGGIPEFFTLGGTSIAPTLTAVTFDKLPPKFAPITMATRHYKAACPKL